MALGATYGIATGNVATNEELTEWVDLEVAVAVTKGVNVYVAPIVRRSSQGNNGAF
jgi:hypothetical protein